MNTMFANPFCTPTTNWHPGFNTWNGTSTTPWNSFTQPGYGYSTNGWWFGNPAAQYPTPFAGYAWNTPTNHWNLSNQPWNGIGNVNPWFSNPTPFSWNTTPWTSWNHNQVPTFAYPNTSYGAPFFGSTFGYPTSTPNGFYPNAHYPNSFYPNSFSPTGAYQASGQMGYPINWFNSPFTMGFHNPGVYNTTGNWNPATSGIPSYPGTVTGTPTTNSYGYPTSFPTPFGNNVPSPVGCAGREAA